jgi:dephospho-CoA kinase
LKPSRCVVITGSIGCGKSSVCDILKTKGYTVIDADVISKAILKENCSKIGEIFGAEYIKNNEIDTKKLGKLVFENKEAKSKLEELMHPKIKKQIFAEIERIEKEDKIYFLDIPLFFESKNYAELSPIAVVYVPKELQLQRVIARDGLSKNDAINRINSQIDIEAKKKAADFVIDNSGLSDNLASQVNIFLEKVEQWFCKNTAQAETTF